MSDPTRNDSTILAFDCFRFDSAACGERLFPITPRSHYYSEVLLVRSGTCRVVRGNHTYTVSPGELLYIGPMVRHSVDSADGKPVVFDVVKYSQTRLRESAPYLSDLRALAMGVAQTQIPVLLTAEETKAWHLDSIIRECIVEYERQDFAWDLQIRALIYLLVTGLARCCIGKLDELPDEVSEKQDPFMDIPAYIEDHISEPLRVEELARRCNLSYPWFAKRFHETYGLSCKQFIEHIRTETVQQYLVYSDLDLADISNRTGFTDCSHMVKDFRRMTGMTPGQFRSLMKIQGRAPFSRFSGQTEPNHPSKG